MKKKKSHQSLTIDDTNQNTVQYSKILLYILAFSFILIGIYFILSDSITFIGLPIGEITEVTVTYNRIFGCILFLIVPILIIGVQFITIPTKTDPSI